MTEPREASPAVLYVSKYKSELHELSPDTIAQGLLLMASGMPLQQLLRRKFKAPHQQYRLFDPQLYLAELDQFACAKAVETLSTYPWFADAPVPEYVSASQSLREWHSENRGRLHEIWRGAVVSDESHMISNAIVALLVQDALEVSARILPAPLRVSSSASAAIEAGWWDAGLAAARVVKGTSPILATIAVSDHVLRDSRPSRSGPLRELMHSLAARRDEIAGCYLVVNQSSVDEYTPSDYFVALHLIDLVADLSRAGIRVVLGPVGVVGAALMACGAQSWATGYYRSYRRVRLADFLDKGGRAYPRLLSRDLAGDLGLERDVDAAWRAGRRELVTDTKSSRVLLRALEAGGAVSNVPEWAYRQSNIRLAQSHYHEVVCELADRFRGPAVSERLNECARWLARASTEARELAASAGAGGGVSPSEYVHQASWSRALDDFLGRKSEGGRI